MMPSSRSMLGAFSGLVATIVPFTAVRADPPVRMDPELAITCFDDKDGVRWRVQCSEPVAGRTGQCITAPDGETDESGKRVRALERARSCLTDPTFNLAALRARGYVVVRGAADAPRGWMRDDRGRVFQVTFDLHRRLYAGVSWAPALHRAGGQDAEPGRTSLDVGLLEIEATTGDLQSGYRHRLRVVEGTVQLAPFGADSTVLRYDLSRRRADPLFRITTFFGTPRRFDIDAHLGGWLELGHLTTGEVAPDREETLWRYGTAHLTWDLWRTPEMDSFVRLRSGAGVERASEEGRPSREAVTWGAAAEGDITLGASGFNRLVLLAQFERPFYLEPAEGQKKSARRGLGRIGYERILIAVNDQPVTARLAGEAEYRDDVPDLAAGWDVRAMAGLRFNLWAPPR